MATEVAAEAHSCEHCGNPPDRTVVTVETNEREGAASWTFCGQVCYTAWTKARPRHALYGAVMSFHVEERPYYAELPEIGRRLRKLRDERGWTQTVAANRCGVGQAAWSKWETGKQLALEAQQKAIAAAFEVAWDAIFGASPQSA